MTDQLEVVSSPTEALKLLEAGHYSSLDVEAFRCFANLYKGEDEVDENDREDLEENCEGVEDDFTTQKLEEKSETDKVQMEKVPLKEEDVEDDPIFEDEKDNIKPTEKEDFVIEEQMLLVKGGDDLVGETETKEEALEKDTEQEDEVDEQAGYEEDHEINDDKCLLGEELEEEEEQEGDMEQREEGEGEEEAEKESENLEEQKVDECLPERRGKCEEENLAGKKHHFEEENKFEEAGADVGGGLEKRESNLSEMEEIGEKGNDDDMDEGRSENGLDLEEETNVLEGEGGGQKRETEEETGNNVDLDESNNKEVENKEIDLTQDHCELEGGDNDSIGTTCEQEEPKKERAGPILMFSTLGRNDEECEDEEEEELTKENEDLTDEESEVMELEMELEELDSALQKGNKEKDLQKEEDLQNGTENKKEISIADICDQLGDIGCNANDDEHEDKVYDSFEEKLQSIVL